MARVNKWKQFGDAFDAVYSAGNTLGKAIQTGGIAFKSYEDEEGNKLSGIALDRAKMDDYAAAEQRFGDPMEALRMRTGVESLGQNKLQTDYLTDTYDERVFQGGLGASNKLRADTAYTSSAAGLNNANARKVGLATDIRAANKENEIASNAAAFSQSTAEANLASSTANLQKQVIDSPIYQESYVAAELAKQGKAASMAQLEEKLANNPKTLETAEAKLQTNLNTALAAVQQSMAELKLKSTQGYQDNYVATGLSQAELGAVQGEEAVLLAQQSLAVNTFIKEWGKTGNPDDPTSMRNLIKGISQINPVMGQKLSQDYGEHELWEITNRSLRMRAETNEALQNRGAAGAQEILDKYNGEQFGIKLVKNDDGSMSMVETRAVGAGGKETEVVRTIASGKDEQAFMQDLNAALDPASLMEYSMNLADIDYKRALAKYSEAQAKSAGVGKPLSATDQAYKTMMNKNASVEDRRLATAFLMRDNPELFAQVMEQMQFDSILSDADGDVPDKLVAPVVVGGPKTEAEQTTAESVMSILTSAESTAAQREEALKGDNRKLIEKYFGKEALEMEDNKTVAVDVMLTELTRGDLNLTPEGVNAFTEKYLNVSQQGSQMDRTGGKKKQAQSVIAAMQEDPMGVLSILIGDLSGKIKDAPARENGAQQRSRLAKNQKLEEQIAELRQLIGAMQGR